MRYVTLLSVLALMFCATLLLGLNACSAGSTSSVTTVTPPPPPPPSKIQHIVIIFQENRTPDNLFQDPF